MRRFWPSGFAGQLIVLTLMALVVAQLVVLWLLVDERRSAIETLRREQMIRRVVGVVDLLQKSQPSFHQQLLEVSSSGLLKFSMAAKANIDLDEDDDDRLTRLEHYLAEALGSRALSVIAVSDHDHDRKHGKRHRIFDLALAIQLDDGKWLNVRTVLPPASPIIAVPTLISLAVAALLIVIVVVVTARRLARPLQDLAIAADGFGRGEQVTAPVERGPREVRHLVQAFNKMRDRLSRFISDRTRMLAAISHDLRTPITSLRLQAELLDEGESRNKILATLEEMQRMVEVTLTFARQDAASEETRVVDLGAMVESICDDLSDLGMPAQVKTEVRPTLACRPVALKRALRNLIENAATHGQGASVALVEGPSHIRITIEDEGPGIPEQAFEEVFEPFVRLERSRNMETGGTGLGMSIARSIIQGHGGDIELANRQECGLQVVATLPRSRC